MHISKGKLIILFSIITFVFSSCETKNKREADFKISLAQWSLHKALFEQKMTTLDFPKIAKEKYGIDAIEYVNQFFADKAEDTAYLSQLKKNCSDYGVKSLLIMIDNEGSLASTDDSSRTAAIENHYKWVKAANFLGCHSIRVNLHGNGTAEEWKNASVNALSRLSNFAEKYSINVIVENHGGFSSDASKLSEVMRLVNKSNCGALPDFGNFCVRREKGDLWESPCVEEYDRYKGVIEMLPFAKGISAKSYDFDEKGNETTINYKKILRPVLASGYKGYIGIEFEGDKLTEEDGIIATKRLLEQIQGSYNSH